MSKDLVLDDFLQFVHVEDLVRVRDGFATGGSGAITRIDDFRVLDRGNQTRWAEVEFFQFPQSNDASHTIAIVRDITERRRHYEERQLLDQELARTQRLEALGVMAGGIAHDFNNLLVPILGNAELLALQMDAPETVAKADSIRGAAEKASDLVRQLMIYAGAESSETSLVNLSQETFEMLDLVKTSVSPNVQLQVDIEDDAIVRGDNSQLRQVIMNLILNAAEAVGESAGHVVVGIAKDKGQIVLSVEDDGCGMDQTTKTRAFEPFYTTKFAGRGLGLSAVMGIVRAHDGELSLDTSLGSGTRVEVRLEAASAEETGAVTNAEEVMQFSGRILLVDDEASVREVGQNLLQLLGFSVELAANGHEAMQKFVRGRFVAVITDLVMPKVDGREVFTAVRQLEPHLPFIVVSGYGGRLVTGEFEGDPNTRFMNKPYRLHQLVATLRDLSVG